MTASSTILKEDFEKLQDNLKQQWKTEFPEEEQPFQVIFKETSEENSFSIEDLIEEGVEKLKDNLKLSDG